MTSNGPNRVILLLFLLAASAAAGNKPTSHTPMTHQTRLQMVRLLSSEFAFVKKPLPMGNKGLVLKPSGELSPDKMDLRMLIAKHGEAARPGDRVQITNIEFHDKSILFEINGGGVKRRKWYQRITISGSGGETPVGDQPNELAKGSFLTLEFNEKVPEMTLAEMKDLLKPVLDFTVKSAAQAYVDSMPENVRNALRDHKVLVGMNKDLVIYSKGRPPQRIREKDASQKDYEEWIFGTPPHEVEFVRFVGDEVVQLKTLTVDGIKTIKNEKEVFLDEPALALGASPGTTEPASAQAQAQKSDTPPLPTKAPSLRRPGEVPPDDSKAGTVLVKPGMPDPNEPPHEFPKLDYSVPLLPAR